MAKFELSPDREKLLETVGHILVLGGPGSGKTTIALLKAHKEIYSGVLKPRQQILFLSFARATIARVAQLAGEVVSGVEQESLQIDTYHGFSWNLLRSHGYLLNKSSPIRLLPPPEAASRLAEIEDKGARSTEKIRLLEEEGLLHFDLFAKKSAELLSKSNSLSEIISNAYPIIILDEFQDTNSDEWSMIQELGKRSHLIALADPEQRIYDFRGADPRRISEFIATYSPTPFDFGSENNRSVGTDITNFGNDLLTGVNKTKNYKNVVPIYYQTRIGSAIHVDLKLAVMKASEELRKSGRTDWSLAVLVPSKQLMLEVSEYLGTEQTFSSGKRLIVVAHDVALETSGPSLAAVLIAGLLECGDSVAGTSQCLIRDLCAHIRGRQGDKTPGQAQLELTRALSDYITSGVIKGSKRKQVIDECQRIATVRHTFDLIGEPGEDWLLIRRLLSDSTSDVIQKVAEDAKHLRLLHKGTVLRSRLSELWRKNKDYSGATAAVKNALTQEHFSSSTIYRRGVQVMTIHKSKGKEFDEVIIYEGRYQGRIVHADASEEQIAKSRLMLRVAVTRAIKNVIIFTPAANPCILLC